MGILAYEPPLTLADRVSQEEGEQSLIRSRSPEEDSTAHLRRKSLTPEGEATAAVVTRDRGSQETETSPHQ
jgi:hypothetical protein